MIGEREPRREGLARTLEVGRRESDWRRKWLGSEQSRGTEGRRAEDQNGGMEQKKGEG